MLKALTDFVAAVAGGRHAAVRAVDDRQIAAAALIIHLAEIDGRVTAEEDAWLRRAVSRYTGLAGVDVDHFIRLAGQRDRESGDVIAMISDLRRTLSADERLFMLTLMWRMALSDGRLHEFEDDLIQRAADLLEIPPAEAARIRAEAGQA